MIRDPESLEAIKAQFAHAEVPVCAADRGLRLLWQTDSRAGTLFAALLSQLSYTDFSPCGNPFPQDGEVVLEHADSPVICRIQTLGEGESLCYVIQFCPLPAQRPFTLSEARAVMQAQTTAGRNAAISILQVVHKLEDLLHQHAVSSDPAVMRMLYESCYSLLNRDLRCGELLWYESRGTDAAPAKIGTVFLSLELERFLDSVTNAACGCITRGSVEIAPELYTAVDARRLQFVLLMLFVRLQDGDPARTVLSLSAEQHADKITVRITVRSGADAAHDAQQPFRRTPGDSTLLSDAVLVQRFCELFGVSCRYDDPQPDVASCTLQFRAAAGGPEAPLLRSASARYAGDRCSLAHVMLSEVLSASAFFQR